MEPAVVKTDLINTLNILKTNEAPALTEEVCNYFIISNKSAKIENNLIVSTLKELAQEKKVFLNSDGYVSLSEISSENIKRRLDLEESTREKSKYGIQIFKSLNMAKYIRFVGAIGDAPFGRIDPNKKIDLIVVVEKDTKYLAKFFIEKYLSFKFAKKSFNFLKIFEVDDLKWNQFDAENAIRLLNLIVFINREKTYESFMSTNNWIFEIFTNYPLEKVSWGFRVSKNIGKPVSDFYKKLNNLLTPKN
jgi:hypothetical protein